VTDHTLIVGLLSPFSDKVQAIFPAGGYLEKCFATVEARYRALGAGDRRAIEAIIHFPS
jgi:hypothetical protein